MWVSIKKKENANAAWRNAIQTYTKLANTGPTDNTVSHVKRESQLKKKKKKKKKENANAAWRNAIQTYTKPANAQNFTFC